MVCASANIYRRLSFSAIETRVWAVKPAVSAANAAASASQLPVVAPEAGTVMCSPTRFNGRPRPAVVGLKKAWVPMQCLLSTRLFRAAFADLPPTLLPRVLAEVQRQAPGVTVE